MPAMFIRIGVAIAAELATMNFLLVKFKFVSVIIFSFVVDVISALASRSAIAF